MKHIKQIAGALKSNLAEIVANRPGGMVYLLNCGGIQLQVIATIDDGWEHVSVTVAGHKRCPTWEEMSFIKDFFWMSSEWVMQFHPPDAVKVNEHPYCLHLWRPLDGLMKTPERWMVR